MDFTTLSPLRACWILQTVVKSIFHAADRTFRHFVRDACNCATSNFLRRPVIFLSLRVCRWFNKNGHFRLTEWLRACNSVVFLCLCLCGGVVVFCGCLWLCDCVYVVVWLCFCGCVFVSACVFVVVWLCFCVVVLVFLWWCGCVFAFLCLCFCGSVVVFCGGVVVFLCLCFYDDMVVLVW